MATRGADAPVAVSQEGMLWNERFAPGSFNLPCLVRRYQGPLDVPAFEAALAEMVRRHQPLRSTFVIDGGRPGQVVGEGGRFSLAVVDLSGASPGDRDREVADLLADATARPFDLATGPLFEPTLVRLGSDDHVFVVRLHHTVFDDWSVDVFRRELSALYAAGVTGEPSPLVEPQASFADVCRRRRALLDGGRGATQLDWWRQELAGAPLAVQLPIGAGDAAPHGGEPLRFDLPSPLAAAVRALAPALRATPYMTVLAAFSVLLSRATGQDDLVLATVVAHRDESDVEPLIGCFTKKVPLRLRLDADPTFAELVARTRTSLLGSLAHQDVAFEAAVQAGLGAAAAAHGVVPRMAVVFQAEAPQQARLRLPHLSVGPYDVRPEARRERHFSAGAGAGAPEAGPVWGDGMYLRTFLILSLLDTGDGLALIARGVFSRPGVMGLLTQLQSVLDAVVADPACRLSELAAGPAGPVAGEDVIDIRGFRASRSRLEAALARCPGVAEVAVAAVDDGEGAARLAAYVVPAPGRPPTLTDLRRAVWAALPGALWPAEAVVVDALPHPAAAGGASGRPLATGGEPGVEILRSLWAAASGRVIEPGQSYWQDFSFLAVPEAARKAGVGIGDEQVMRCRTLEMLAATVAPAAP